MSPKVTRGRVPVARPAAAQFQRGVAALTNLCAWNGKSPNNNRFLDPDLEALKDWLVSEVDVREVPSVVPVPTMRVEPVVGGLYENKRGVLFLYLGSCTTNDITLRWEPGVDLGSKVYNGVLGPDYDTRVWLELHAMLEPESPVETVHCILTQTEWTPEVSRVKFGRRTVALKSALMHLPADSWKLLRELARRFVAWNAKYATQRIGRLVLPLGHTDPQAIVPFARVAYVRPVGQPRPEVPEFDALWKVEIA